ncbi:acyl homoserine lactone synthase [Rhizobium sp. BK196]|uniref:acyl-homoserine-lactone synthase n=1 Tax=Rhizobium sp. BK196 TaxID=2587073 RepID=UPI00161127D8|nr:acyl-homoserine-lactone synthase [Rhizobium sp. BK196]MBB3313398.1 acyl homoserine lactone synthase [Rhizobium sp. BK196]
MFATAIAPADAASDSYLLDTMFRLRARVFGGRLNWEVTVEEGRERDRFDDLAVSYIIIVDEGGEAIASARLLPALGPTMLVDVFPELLGDRPFVPHARMVESSRFCVDTETKAAAAGAFGLNEATVFLFAGILEWCLAKGMTEIATVTDLRFERILKRVAWPLARYGKPRLIGNVMSVAGSLPVSDEHFQALRPAAYRSTLSTCFRCAA